jgi:hypothetical protein
MKHVERAVISLFLLVILFCLHQLIGPLFEVHKWMRLDASAGASWVQAVGSIAAIVGAFAIAKKQADEANQQRAKDHLQSEADLCRTALLISMDAAACVFSVNKKFTASTPPRGIGPERIEEVLHALRSLAAKNLTFDIHSEVLALQRELAYTLTAVREYNNLVPLTPERREKSAKRAKAIAEASRNLLQLAKGRYHLPETMLP